MLSMSRSVRTRCKGHSTACGWSVCAQLTARRQAFLIRSISSKIWAFAGLSLSPDPCFRITCRTEVKSTPEQNRCSMPSHRGWSRATLSKPFRFGRLQPRTSSSADARQRARSSCFHSNKRSQKARQTTSATHLQKENIMSIIRHEIRQISDDNRDQPIISQAVVHGNVAYFAGITPNPIVGDIKTQTAQVLRRVDELLNLAGTDKSKLLSAQVWIADMRLFEDHNSVWNDWVDPANPPARACLTTDFWRPGMLVEVMVVAALP